MRSVSKRLRAAPGGCTRLLAQPESITQRTPGTVREVSATLVVSTQRFSLGLALHTILLWRCSEHAAVQDLQAGAAALSGGHQSFTLTANVGHASGEKI